MNEIPLTPPHTHINPARLVALVVVAVLSFGVGMYVGVSTGSSVSLPMDTARVETGSFEEGYASARARLIERGIISDMSAVQTDSVTGEVVRVEGNTLVLRVDSGDPLSDPLEVSIATNGSTQVERLTDRDPAEYESLFREYTEAMEAVAQSEEGMTAEYPTPPDFYTRTQTSLSSITPGQAVTIVTTEPLPLSAPARTAQRIEYREVVSVPQMPEGDTMQESMMDEMGGMEMIQ
jgi:hypothetical protein